MLCQNSVSHSTEPVVLQWPCTLHGPGDPGQVGNSFFYFLAWRTFDHDKTIFHRKVFLSFSGWCINANNECSGSVDKKYFSVLHCERIPWLQLLVYIRLILNKVSFTTAIWITYILNQKSCFRFGNKIVFAAVINNKRPCFLIIPVISVSINMHAEGCIGQPSLISLYK